MKTDLHTHSQYSDGTDSPDDIIRKCIEEGIEYISLTDHDTVRGTKEFLQKAYQTGIHALSGLEMSVEHETELHILFYGYDPDDAALHSALLSLEEARRERMDEMLFLMQKDHLDITGKDLLRVVGDGVPARPHIAQLLMEKGYCSSIAEAFDRFIGEGCRYYVKKRHLTKEETFSLAARTKAKTVIAHPSKIGSDDFEILLKELIGLGLNGIEVFYPIHSDKECGYYLSLARKNDLLVTQGSDNHGKRRTTFIGQETRGNSEQLLYSSIEKLFFN